MNIFMPMGYAHTSLIKEDWIIVVQIKGHLFGERPLPHNRKMANTQTRKEWLTLLLLLPTLQKGDCIIHPSIHSAYIIAHKTLFKMSIDLGILPWRACGIVRKITHACKQIRCRYHSLLKVKATNTIKDFSKELTTCALERQNVG